MKSFQHWTLEDVEDTFAMVKREGSPLLDHWLNGEKEGIEYPTELLRDLQSQLRRKFDVWNEEELKIKFIAPILQVIHYDQERYQAFLEREVSAAIDGDTVSGIVELIVAQGRRSPKVPFFCLHEYKPEIPSSKDPFGQTLIAMVAAHLRNQNEQPVYGACVIGRLWHFLALDGQEYAMSLGFDATKDDLFDIFRILSYLKTIIETELLQPR